MIQRTSLEAYHVIEPELNERQHLILDTIKQNPGISNHELSQFLGLEINSITPRVKELRDKGLVVCCGTKKDTCTGMNVMTWKIVVC
jgi:DNA-binding MarR family transcriptional regulator